MKKKLIILFLIANLQTLICHNSEMIGGLTIGGNYIINYSENRNICLSPDINATLALFNFGNSFQYQLHSNPSYNYYIGIGFLNVLQIQYGTNFSDNRIKIRSIIPLFSDTSPSFATSREKWYKRINLQLHYESNLNNSILNNFGIGVSYLVW